MVGIKVAAVLFVILVGAFFINPDNWTPFAPYGLTGVSFFGHTLFGQVNAGGQPVGMLAGAAIIFFAYIGFDSVSHPRRGGQEPEARRADRHHRLAGDLHGALHRRRRRADRHGPLRQDRASTPASPTPSSRPGCPGPSSSSRRRRGRHHLGAAGHDAVGAARLPGHGPRRAGAPGVLRRRPPDVPDPWKSTILIGVFVAIAGRLPAHRRAAAPDQHRHAVRLRHRLRRGADHAADQPRRRAAVPCPLLPVVPILGILQLPAADVLAAGRELVAADRWLASGWSSTSCTATVTASCGKRDAAVDASSVPRRRIAERAGMAARRARRHGRRPGDSRRDAPAVAAFTARAGRPPGLGLVLVGNDPGVGALRRQQAEVGGGQRAQGRSRAPAGDGLARRAAAARAIG